METIEDSIRALAFEEGFDAVGFAAATPAGEGDQLADWLAEGRQGGMDWMAETADRRQSPTALWPEARSVIVLGLNYCPPYDPLAGLAHGNRGWISASARGRDYHDLVKSRLKRLARRIVEIHGGEVKLFVDTAPVMEKPLASRTSVGWQGKHTVVVSRRFGSWLVLGEIFTTIQLEPDRPETRYCGYCKRCAVACPTGALRVDQPYRMDARRCISYLTIEHGGDIDEELMALMGNRVYGCDDCITVCPWNKYAKASNEPGFSPRIECLLPSLADLVALDDTSFRQVFAGSPVKRIGRERMVRNALIAIGNSGDSTLKRAAAALLNDPSSVIRRAAAWALGRI